MVEEFTAKDLKRRLAEGADIQIVDVRPPQAYRRGHIPGAINVPIDEFVDQVPIREWADEIVLVCPHGLSSRQAGLLLESYEGIDSSVTVANLTSGYEGWPYDLERDSTDGNATTDPS